MDDKYIALLVVLPIFIGLVWMMFNPKKWVHFFTGPPITKEEIEGMFNFIDKIQDAKDEMDIEEVRRRVAKEKRIKEIENELEASSGNALDKRIDDLIRKSKK